MGSSRPHRSCFHSVLITLLPAAVWVSPPVLADDSEPTDVWEAFQRPPSADDWAFNGAAAYDDGAHDAFLASDTAPGSLFLDLPFRTEGLWTEFDLTVSGEAMAVVALAAGDDPHQLGSGGDGSGFRGIAGVGVAFAFGALPHVALIDGTSGALLDRIDVSSLPPFSRVRVDLGPSPGQVHVTMAGMHAIVLDLSLHGPAMFEPVLVGFTAAASSPSSPVSVDRVEVSGFPRADVCVAAGNVNANDILGIEDVLFLDHSLGSDTGDRRREIRLDRGEAFAVEITPPWSAATARYVLYGFIGSPGLATITAQPFGIGPTLFATPLSSGPVSQAVVLANTIGADRRLGRGRIPDARPAPSIVWRNLKGFRSPVVFALQGIIEDRWSQSAWHFSVTNGFTVFVP